MNGNGANDEQLEVSSVYEWKKQAQDGEHYRLPGSGLVAKLRRPGLMAMVARAGQVPNKITAEVLRFLADTGDPLQERTAEQRLDIYQKNAKAFRHIAQLAFVFPKLVDKEEPDYANGEIPFEFVPDTDYAWLVFNFVEGRADEILPFRVAGGPRENGRPSSEVRDEATPVVPDIPDE